MTDGDSDGYLWANRHSEEERRLRLLEGLADARSFRLLTQAGVGAEWRYAELGAGGGSVAGWLSDRVGPAGLVLAVDLDARFLMPLTQRPNVQIVEADLATIEMASGSFDLVHTRNVLVHLGTPRKLSPSLSTPFTLAEFCFSKSPTITRSQAPRRLSLLE